LAEQLHIPKEWIEGCLQNIPASQEAVYKACYVPFMKICLRYTRDYDEAANVLHDAFIKIFTKLGEFAGKGAIEGWMRRIVVHTAIDHVRKQKLHPIVSLHASHDVREEQEDQQKYIVDEQQVLQHIHQLPQMHALVFNLFVMDNNSHQEIADQLQISVASSKWYLFEARKILQQKLAIYIHGEE
jgi:RNA polymerase sigma factor (sigma-70 family)